MSSLRDSIDALAFRDELATATEIKTGVSDMVKSADLSNFDFSSDTPLTETEEVTNYPRNRIIEEVEEEDDYDAQQNATSLVYTLTAVDSLVLSGVVQMKCRSNAGGSKNLKKMKTVLTKELSGEELTDHEKMLKAKFQEYKANIKLLSDEVIPNEKEISRLIDSAVPFCEATKFKMGAGTAFWTSYAGSLVSRITKVLTA